MQLKALLERIYAEVVLVRTTDHLMTDICGKKFKKTLLLM